MVALVTGSVTAQDSSTPVSLPPEKVYSRADCPYMFALAANIQHIAKTLKTAIASVPFQLESDVFIIILLVRYSVSPPMEVFM
jgi:hypothetical protein